MTVPGQVNPSKTVHNPPPEKRGVVRRLTPKQIAAIGGVLVELILAQVALALGGINILGVHPFGYLTQWGQDLQQRAQDAYNRAIGAESVANTADANAAIAQGTASTANTGLVTTWNNLWDASFNTSNSTGKTAADVLTAQGTVRSTAASGVALAGTAQTSAEAAAGTAQGTIDGIYSAVMGGVYTGMPVSSVQTSVGGLSDFSRGVAGAGSNLVVDPGGEKSFFWTGQTGVARSATYKRNGTYSVAVTSAGSTARTLFFNTTDTGAVQPYVAREGEIYYVECWVFCPTGNANGTVELVAQTNGTTFYSLASTAFISGNKGSWVQMYGQGSLPSGTTTVSFGIRLAGSATTSGNVFYVDDMLVREITNAQAAQNTASIATSSASTANGNIQNTWDAIWNGLYTINTYGRSYSDVQTGIGGLADLGRGYFRSGANLLADPGAEKTTFWGGQTGVAQSSAYKRNGSYSAVLTSAGATARTLFFNTVDAGAVQPFDVREGDIYYTECYFYAPAANTGTGTVELVIQLDSSTTTVLSSYGLSSGTKGSWILLAGQYIIGSGVSKASFGIRLASGQSTAGDLFYVDDMAVREISYSQYVANAVYNGLTGDTLDFASPDDVQQATSETNGTITDLNGKVDELTSGNAANALSGSSAAVNFSTVTSLANPPWTIGYTSTGTNTGTIDVVSSRAAWVPVGLDKRRAFAVYNATSLSTDYHRVGAVLASKPNFSSSYPPANYLIARSTTDATTCVYAKLYQVFSSLFSPPNTKVEVWCVVSGSATKLGETTATGPIVSGATYWFEAGTSAGLHKYRVLRDSKALLSVTTESEVTPTSKVGADFATPASYRYCGFGLEANSGPQNIFKPASIGAWTARDNSPVAVIGSGFKISRTSTTKVNASGAGSYVFPQNFFDSSPEATTTDYTYTDTSGTPGKLVVATSGWYMVTASVAFDVGAGDQNIWPLLYKNGSIVQRGNPAFGTGVGPSAKGLNGTFVVYLSKNDYIQMGYQTGGFGINNLFTGDAGGLNTYWSVAFLNNTKPVEPTTT